MTLIINPKKLLKVLWEARFETIFLYGDGAWDVDEKRRNNDIISLSRSKLTGSNKLEALNQLMILNTKLLDATSEMHAKIFREEYEFERELWAKQERSQREYSEYNNQIYKEEIFEYNPFPTIEWRIEEYYYEYYIDHISSLVEQLSLKHNINIEMDFGDAYVFSPADESLYLLTPFNEKVAFFIAGENGRPKFYVDNKHFLFPILQNEVLRVTKLALDDAQKSVKQDLREWFKSQFGYDIH